MRGAHLMPQVYTSRAFVTQDRPWLSGATVRVVLQVRDGTGCPLLSLVNALALSGALRIPAPGIYAFEELCALVQAHIEKRTAALLAALAPPGAPPPPAALADTVALLVKRAAGAAAALRTFSHLSLDVVPASALAHSDSEATAVYEAAGVRLLHGAVAPPGTPLAAALGAQSEIFAESSCFEDPASQASLLIQGWLAQRPSAGGNLFLSPAGLASLRAALHPHQAAVAYLNDRACSLQRLAVRRQPPPSCTAHTHTPMPHPTRLRHHHAPQ